MFQKIPKIIIKSDREIARTREDKNFTKTIFPMIDEIQEIKSTTTIYNTMWAKFNLRTPLKISCCNSVVVLSLDFK